jgi:hypothetical protein
LTRIRVLYFNGYSELNTFTAYVPTYTPVFLTIAWIGNCRIQGTFTANPVFNVVNVLCRTDWLFSDKPIHHVTHCIRILSHAYICYIPTSRCVRLPHAFEFLMHTPFFRTLPFTRNGRRLVRKSNFDASFVFMTNNAKIPQF